MIRPISLFTLALLLTGTCFVQAREIDHRTYRVRQTVTLSHIDRNSESIRWWVSVPHDNRNQEVLDLAVVSAPGTWRLVREPERGNQFLLVETSAPQATSLDVVVEFTLLRRAVRVDLDPDRTGPIDPSQRALFADYLRRDAPHMEVTPRIQRLADGACGAEENVARQARLLIAKVAALADHYSKDPSKPRCGVGDAEDCMTNGGGCCTDLHSLFIALARARGIPARLQMGYRLLAGNAGKEVDPGYRCWVEYFAPGFGWVPSDIVEADAPKGLGLALWSSGLTVERLWLNEGRELLLDSGSDTRRVNHMSIGHAEIDGVPARVLPEGDLPAQLSRRVRFEILQPGGTTALSDAR